MKVILSNENRSRKNESMRCIINLSLSFFKEVTGGKPFIFFIALTLVFLTNVTSLFSQNPNWTTPNSGAFTYNASVIARVHFNAATSNHMNDRIAFFVGSQLRGLSTPVQAGNSVIHFITVNANQITEVMQVKIYHHSSNLVYDVVTPFYFVANNIYVNINQPMIFNVYTHNNTPLNINPIPPQQTIQGLAFNNISLNNFLVQPDPYPVEWTYTPNANLHVRINNGILSVSVLPSFSGQTSLTVRATELGPFPPPVQFAERTIIYNVTAAYDGPEWNPIPSQGIVKGYNFQNADLNVYEYQYGGPYIEYSYEPVLSAKIPPVSAPNWIQPTNLVNSMLMTAQVNYTPYHQFIHPNDRLAAFVNNQLRGVASVHPSTGLFFLSIGSNLSSGEVIKYKLYSAEMQEIISLRDSFIFVSGNIIGMPTNPVNLDFTPILPMINSSGMASFVIRDTSFVGEVAIKFTAYDSLYPGYLNDQTITKLCMVNHIADLDTFYRDADGDGLGNPNIFIKACSLSEGYVANDDDCDDNSDLDPVVTFTLTENSGILPNDGNLCNGGSVTMSATGGIAYLWNTGATTNSITMTPSETTSYRVTITLPGGICHNVIPFDVFVETSLIKSSANEGNGSLRNVLFCISEGDTILFNLPLTTHSHLTQPLLIGKNVMIEGLSPLVRPMIRIDFLQTNSGITIEEGKTLTLKNIDINTLWAGTYSTFSGPGQINIQSLVNVKSQ